MSGGIDCDADGGGDCDGSAADARAAAAASRALRFIVSWYSVRGKCMMVVDSAAPAAGHTRSTRGFDVGCPRTNDTDATTAEKVIIINSLITILGCSRLLSIGIHD